MQCLLHTKKAAIVAEVVTAVAWSSFDVREGIAVQTLRARRSARGLDARDVLAEVGCGD